MNRLYNATGHNQSQYADAYRDFGWDIETEPRVSRVGANELEKEGRRVAAGIPANSCVLIGGAQLLVDAMSIALLRGGCRLYAAHTERESDGDGNFVFNLRGVSETPWSKWWHARRRTR
jgi:hypothetical protein